jgi:hypothetical protein
MLGYDDRVAIVEVANRRLKLPPGANAAGLLRVDALNASGAEIPSCAARPAVCSVVPSGPQSGGQWVA